MRQQYGIKSDKQNGYKKRPKLLSRKMISTAVHGKEYVIGKVLQYYEIYIDKLASRELYDRYGNIYIYRDPILKTELKNKLIEGILKFRING